MVRSNLSCRLQPAFRWRWIVVVELKYPASQSPAPIQGTSYNTKHNTKSAMDTNAALVCKGQARRPSNVPGQIRTADLRFRRPLLYPAELPGHFLLPPLADSTSRHIGSEMPRGGLEPPTSGL